MLQCLIGSFLKRCMAFYSDARFAPFFLRYIFLPSVALYWYVFCFYYAAKGIDLQRSVDAGSEADPRPGSGICLPIQGISFTPCAAAEGTPT